METELRGVPSQPKNSSLKEMETLESALLSINEFITDMHAGADFRYIPKVQPPTGGVCPEQGLLLSGETQPVLSITRREGCGAALNSQGKLPSASPGTQCHHFGAFAAFEAGGMLLNVHPFLISASTNNGNKSQ